MATNNDFAPACPTGCDDGTLLTASDNCLTDESIESGEITDFIIDEISSSDSTLPKTPIGSWTATGLAADASVNETAINTWYDGIDNSTSTIKHFEVIGNLAAAEQATGVGPKKTTIKIGEGVYQVVVDIVKKSNLNYEFHRKLQCGGNYAAWYGTEKYLYGGGNGLIGRVVSSSAPLERGDGYSVIQVTFEWKAKQDPPRDFKPWI